MRGGGCFGWAEGMRSVSAHAQTVNSAPPVKLRRSSGILLHPTSLPDGRLGGERLPLRRLAPRRRPVLVAGAAAQPARRVRLAVRVGVGVRRLARLPRRPRGSGLEARGGAFRARHAYWIDDWEPFAGRRRRGPGALRAGVVGAPRVRGRARRAADRRRADLRGRGQLRPPAHPELFRTGSSPARRPTTSARRAALGQPALRLGRRRRTATAGGRSGCGGALARRRDAHRPLPRLRGVLDDPGGSRSATEGRWRPGPGAAVFHAAERELGELPVIAEDLGVITADVEALRDGLGFPGMVVLLWAFQPTAGHPHRLENHREHAVVYTSTHDTDTLAAPFRGANRGGCRRRAVVARGARDPRPGRARARRRGAHEPAGRADRQLVAGGSSPGRLTPSSRRSSARQTAAAGRLASIRRFDAASPRRDQRRPAPRRRRRRCRSAGTCRRRRPGSTPSARSRACPPCAAHARRRGPRPTTRKSRPSSCATPLT